MKDADSWLRNLRELDLPRRASWNEVQSAYRQLVLAYHPDVNCSWSAAERFRRVVRAYQELVDLRRAREARSAHPWRRFPDDPKVRDLPAEELVQRMRYSTSPRMCGAAAYMLGRKGG